MYKISFFSQSDSNINIVKEILSAPDFYLFTFPLVEQTVTDIKNTRLIIMDICNLEIKNDPYYKIFFKRIAELGKPGLVILNNNQSDIIPFMIEINAGIEDIIFRNQLARELTTKINFILSKIHLSESGKNSITVGGIVLNLEKYELTVDGSPVELTFKEYELLKILIENQNKVFSRSKLLSVVWGYDFYGGSRTVDVHMRRLRTKLEAPYSDMLKTVRNVGYMFSPAH